MSVHAVWEQPYADQASRMTTWPVDFGALTAPRPNVSEDIAPTSLDLETHALDWEAEIEAPAPPNDPAVWQAAKAAQVEMAKHAPIDTWPDLGDLSAYLPENASFLPAIDDPEAHARLRRLFLRALREGSVPDDELIEVSRAPEGAQDEARAEVYRTVLADMGCQVDERWELADAFDDYTVHVDPVETPEEEDELTDTLAHIGELTTARHDPFYLYQREAQSHRLLSAEEEVGIAQAMEASLELALDALAAWPEGISRLLGAAKAVQSGNLSMRWLSVGPRQDAPLIQDEDAAVDVAVAPVAAAPDSEPPASGTDEDGEGDPSTGSESDSPDAEFFAAAELLSAVAIDPDHNSPAWAEARGLLASMRIASSFLLKLTEEAMWNKSDAAIDFRRAMAVHRRERDRMAIGNLKLVLFQAKKYMHSGEPLGDLVQEGNIGLLRAVDKFDWRRGFRFSTFATWWVRQGLSRHVADKSRTIRLPVHVFEEVHKVIRESEAFEELMSRAPEPGEIAARLGLAERRAATLMRIGMEPLPFDEIDFDFDKHIEPSAADEFVARDPMEIVSQRQLEGTINEALKCLALKDERIIRQRFGLGGLAEHTLDEIGTRMGVTRERVRQIESKALAKLRHPSLAGLLDPSKARARARAEDSESEAETSASDAPPPINPMEDTVLGGPLRMVPIAVNKALRLAESMKACVEDDRLGSTGKIWVRVDDDEYTHISILIPKLVELGFAREAGKGYWR